MKSSYCINIAYIILIRIFFAEGVTKCESRVELRAVLLTCPPKESSCEEEDPLTQAMNAEEAQILHGSKNIESMKAERERGFPTAVKDCKRKIVITLKMKNIGKIPCDDEYIIVDHVFDPITGGKGRLLSPVVLKLRQEQMIQLYGLQFQRVVNSDPFEKQKVPQDTCSVDPANPTCGIVTYNGKPIPFSQGFCCSSDSKRQAIPEYFDLKSPEGRYSREERPPVEILNPQLLEVKQEVDYDVSGEENDQPEEDKNLIKELTLGKIPNFLLEGDRKIVCDRGDFLVELCKLQNDRNSGKADTSFNNANILNKVAFQDRFAGEADNSKQKPVFENEKKGTERSISDFSDLLNKEVDTVDSQRFSGGDGVQEKVSQAKTSWKDILNESFLKGSNRDKRENEHSSNKGLSLNERLERFSKMKSHKKRRKRLLEIPHRRQRQPDPGCQGGECIAVTIAYLANQDGARSEPPEYFFSHDKSILNPDLPSILIFNSTESIPVDKLSTKSSSVEKFLLEENKSQNLDDTRKSHKNEETPDTEKKTQSTSTKEWDYAKGLNEQTEGDNDAKKNASKERDDTNDRQRHPSQKSQSETDEMTEEEVRNYLASKEREKQAPQLEIITHQPHPPKKLEQGILKHVAFKDLLEKSKEKEKAGEARVFEVTKVLKPNADTKETFKTQQGFNRKHTRPVETKLSDGEKTYLKSRGSKAPSSVEVLGAGPANVDYDVDIDRKQGTDMSDFRVPPLYSEQSLRRRVNAPRRYAENKMYDLDDVALHKLVRNRNQMHRGDKRYSYPKGRFDDRRSYYGMRMGHPFQYSREHHKNRWKGYEYRAVDQRKRQNPYWSQRRNLPVFKETDYQRRRFEPEENGDKVRIKRTSAYSFEVPKGFFGSDLKQGGRRYPKFLHRLEGCQQSFPEEASLWRFPLKSLDSRFSSSPFFNGSFVEETWNAKMARDRERLMRSYANGPEEREPLLKGKRQAKGKGEHKTSSERDRYAGAYTQDTAHCMKFGDLWYSMYSIKKPLVAQIVGVQLFDKRTLYDGTTQWRDLTKGKMVRIGTFLPKAEDELPTISMTYMGGKTKKLPSAIDPDSYLLLIPSHVSDPSKASYYPQFEGGPGEYLLVESKDVSSGEECNMVGTSFEAFVRRPDRCSENRGSCLKRQPVDLWREDMEARIRGKRGKYFVENFGTIPNSAVKTFTNFTGEFLALEYYGDYASVIEVELKADSNAIIRKGSNAQIPSVYIDSTYPKKTRIVLSVLNIGLTSAYFRPRLGDCPPNLDSAWCPLEGPLVTIPPQQRHDFKLDLSGVLPSNKIRVTVQVLNQYNKKVAYRKITIKNGDRCVCAFHCECCCVGGQVHERTCHKLPLQEYRGAGYLGGFPFRGGAATSASENLKSHLHIVFITALYVLLLFGAIKALLGIYFRRLGIAGTRVIVGPRKLCRYYEYELQFCSVLLDECGFPVHPTTYAPVQIVPLLAEVVINVFFFFLYPLRGLWFLISSSSCCKAACPGCDGCCRHDEDLEYDKCSRPLLSKNVQPTCVNYNLTTFNATKQETEEYLHYLPYKGNDDPLEEDDTDFVLREMKRYRNK